MLRKTIFSVLLVNLFALLNAFPAQAQSSPARQIFDVYTGRWQGVFRIFSLDGTLLDSIRVEQHYFWDGDIQRVELKDHLVDGSVQVSHAENFVRNDSLFCVVTKADSTRIIETGKRSANRLFWYHVDKAAQRRETFKEYVQTVPGGTYYLIDGIGIYGEGEHMNILLFEGRYKKIANQ